MGVHPFRPGSHVEVDGKQQRWWVGASVLPCAFSMFVAGDLERIRFSCSLVKLVGSSPFPYQSAHSVRFQLLEPFSRREARGRFGMAWAVGQWAFFPSKASAFVGGARAMGRVVEGETRLAKARSTGQRQREQGRRDDDRHRTERTLDEMFGARRTRTGTVARLWVLVVSWPSRSRPTSSRWSGRWSDGLASGG